MKLIEFDDISRAQWDEYVYRIPDANFMHTSWFIDILNLANGISGSKSFIFLEGDSPVAICPLAVCKVQNYGNEYNEATFKGYPNPYPALIKLPSAQRRRIVRNVFALIAERLKPYNVKRIEFYRHPINLGFLNNNVDVSNIAEAISFGYFCYLKNTIIVDLRKDESELMYDMSRPQRKNIDKAKRCGLVIKEYRGDVENFDKVFSDFQLAHFKSAGRLTRPQDYWDKMKELVRFNMATLFVASIVGKTDISYLYCGEFDKLSFGWSQVNIDEFEKEYSPRHLLEWEAMMFYKKRGYSYYEIGIKYDSPQLYYIPTDKEISISQFKERYGGKLYCQFYFEKFLDNDLLNLAYKERLEKMLSSKFISSTEEDNRYQE